MPKKTGHRRPSETIKFSAEEVQDFALTSKRCAALLVVQGAESDLGTHVVCDRPITLGRDLEVELPLRDGAISRMHCRIERIDDQGPYVLRDLGSTNGTRLNGKPVMAPEPLSEGDKIFLGSSVIRFSYADGFDVEYHAKLESIVTTDPLTGLLSQRRFDGEFALAVQQARGDGAPLAVLVMDMDGLKQINDAHGHDMGGFAIAETAGVIREATLKSGGCCRFGGDEFMAFLHGLDKAAAVAIAEAIRDGVERHVFVKEGVRIAPTISIGIAALPEDGDTPEDLFRAADRALYRAKKAGRNQVAT